jgi:eukaryotic-like serine/threonine-protein kinase
MVQVAAGSIIASKYFLERPLARGGMGTVWVARHLQLDSEVAIKFMAPEYGAHADLRARFEREAKASALMKVANVVHKPPPAASFTKSAPPKDRSFGF